MMIGSVDTKEVNMFIGMDIESYSESVKFGRDDEMIPIYTVSYMHFGRLMTMEVNEKQYDQAQTEYWRRNNE